MEQNIVVERHYLTPQMYREMYLGYTYYFTNRYQQPHFPFINQNPILAPSYNQIFPVFPQPTNQPANQPTNHLVNHPANHPTNHLANQPVANQPVQNNEFLNNRVNGTDPTRGTPNNNIAGMQAPAEIRNLINNLINNNTPFQLEVSTLPIARILNQFRAEINANEDNDNSGINLANINNISNVNVFSSLNTNIARGLTNSNTTEEMCSICQTDFEGHEIVRLLNNCSHLFHLNCIDTWLSNHNTCPTCRHNLMNDMPENNSEEEGANDDTDDNNEADDNNEDEDDNDDSEEDANESIVCENAGCHSECEYDCNCHEDYTDCEDDENTDNNESSATASASNHTVNSRTNDELNGFINYFVITNSRNSGNASNIAVLSSNPSQLPSSTSINSSGRSRQVGITNNNSNIHILTSSSGSVNGTSFGEFQNDLNNIINLGTPLINTIMGTNNTASQLNSTHINGQVNSVINAINPLLAAFSSMMINTNNNTTNNTNNNNNQ